MDSRSSPQVFMCVDAGFTLPLAVSLASLNAAQDGTGATVHVAHPRFDASLREKIQQGLSELTIHWVAVDDDVVRGAHHPSFLSRASLYRLLAGELLPENLGRVIYLDADTVVVSALGHLWETQLGPRDVVAAVREAQSPWAAGPLGTSWRTLGLPPSAPYFNSGVLLIDLERWREADVGGSCLRLLRERRPRWGDQDALNAVLQNRWLELPRRWNVQSGDWREDSIAWALWRDHVEAALASPAVVHYTERDKPWQADSEHVQRELWFSWLDSTAWAGWRPATPVVPRWEGWARAAGARMRDRRSARASRLPR